MLLPKLTPYIMYGNISIYINGRISTIYGMAVSREMNYMIGTIKMYQSNFRSYVLAKLATLIYKCTNMLPWLPFLLAWSPRLQTRKAAPRPLHLVGPDRWSANVPVAPSQSQPSKDL